MENQLVIIQISKVNETDLLVEMSSQDERDLFLSALSNWISSWGNA